MLSWSGGAALASRRLAQSGPSLHVESGLVAARLQLNQHRRLLLVTPVVRIVYFRVERYQHYIILCDVLHYLGKFALLVSFRSVHQAVIIVWHAIFKIANKTCIAEEDLLSHNFHILRHAIVASCHLLSKVVLPAEKHAVYFLEDLEVYIDNAFIACLSILQCLKIICRYLLLHILEDFTDVQWVGVHVTWIGHFEIFLLESGAILLETLVALQDHLAIRGKNLVIDCGIFEGVFRLLLRRKQEDKLGELHSELCCDVLFNSLCGALTRDARLYAGSVELAVTDVRPI